MTYYFKNGTAYRPTDEANVDIRTELPPGNYIIRQAQDGSLFFDTVDTFTFAGKRYGANPRHTRRILDTFYKRSASTGVMLAGEKGSGKSLLAKTISMEAVNDGIPTIIINAAWHGEGFNALVQSIDQPAIILFDEFEKVYDAEQQEQILTLLDGVFPTKKLFVFTCNDKWRIDQHMRNRPGRIFYMLDFKGLDAAFVEEYCNDNLINKTHIPAVCRLSELFTQFNFDMLKALVEEMNRYDETPAEALEMLNVRPEFDDGRPTFTITLMRDGTVIRTHQKEYQANPLTLHFRCHYYLPVTAATSVDARDEDDDDYDDEGEEVTPANPKEAIYEVTFTDDHLVSIRGDVYEFATNGMTLLLTKKVAARGKDWRDVL